VIPVRFSARSLADRDRVLDFLAQESPAAEERAIELLSQAIKRISEFPNIGIAGPSGYRRLILSFGKAGYEIRYRVYPTVVVVTRIFHTREDR